jgi:uncharacterized protein (TIGR03435 family)
MSKYAAQAASANTAPDAGVLGAVDKLGLKLELSKVPQPVLAVESVNEQPSANAPGVEANLPPLPPPQFEVAAIQWPCQGNMSIALRFEPGGRATATCMALLYLIKEAWGLSGNEQLAGIPKWLADGSTTKYNISIAAKAPAGIAPDPQKNAEARDILNGMLRALLLDRYKMTVHYENRPMDAYTLVAAKPKLAKADPASRTGCTRQNPQSQGRALIVRLACQNMTMAQFAEQIQAYDVDMRYPVLDGTGITGAWDFTVTYDAMAGLNARYPLIAGAAANTGVEASEPSSTLSFIEAVNKQLGLKLESQKRPEPVLVIDHIEEKPAEN